MYLSYHKPSTVYTNHISMIQSYKHCVSSLQCYSECYSDKEASLDALATFSWSKYRCCIFRFIYLALEVSWNSIHYCLLIISISKFVQQNMLILDIVRKLINDFQKEAIQSGFNAWASPVKNKVKTGANGIGIAFPATYPSIKKSLWY